jgi:glycosyltransferase involved in cell wall biosynthesis
MTDEDSKPPTGDAAPLVSIGLFAHNEGAFIRQSLDSLLAQDYPNLEIVISDNCSSDDTANVCSELAAQDDRIRFERQETNIGAAANSIRVLERSRGKYFMWASGHDLWSPGIVSLCVSALEKRPLATVAYGPARWIDADGNPLPRESGCYDSRGMNTMDRLFITFWGNLHPVLGIIRAESLKSIPKLHACAGSDQIVMAELALRGEILFIPDAHWSRREPRGHETRKEKMNRYTSDDFGLTGSWLDRTLPLLRLPLEILRAVWRSDLRFTGKLATSLALLPAFLVRYISGRQS